MPALPAVLPDEPVDLENAIHEHGQSFAPLKQNNEAKIVWADEAAKEKTEYSIAYLHGFAASRREGFPWHRAIGKKFGCNLYLARLHSHGLKRKHFFEGFTVLKLLSSAVDACRIAQKLGEKVLIMGTSAGASLALCAAGSAQCPVSVKGLMLVSPLIHFYGCHSLFLENEFGRFLAKTIRGSDYKQQLNTESSLIEKEIWYPFIPLSAALTLGTFLQNHIHRSLFSNVKCPVFVGYYFKNKLFHDRIVSPHAILRLKQQLGTASSKQHFVNFPQARSHVIGSGLLSKSVAELTAETIYFLKKKAGVEPIA